MRSRHVLASWALGYDERECPGWIAPSPRTPPWRSTSPGSRRLGPFVGRDAVIKDMTDHQELEKDQTRHVVTNVVIDRKGEDEAPSTRT